jgi:hypothetical protein
MSQKKVGLIICVGTVVICTLLGGAVEGALTEERWSWPVAGAFFAISTIVMSIPYYKDYYIAKRSEGKGDPDATS